ncbi:unnamed protein product [Urochloa humidicola]
MCAPPLPPLLLFPRTGFPPTNLLPVTWIEAPGHHVAAAVVAMFQPSCPLGAPTAVIHLVGYAPARHRQLPVGIEEAGARHGQGMEFGWDVSQAILDV